MKRGAAESCNIDACLNVSVNGITGSKGGKMVANVTYDYETRRIRFRLGDETNSTALAEFDIPFGDIIVAVLKNNTLSLKRIDNTLKSFQALVGGDVQLFPHKLGQNADMTAYVNEEGMLLDLPHNTAGKDMLQTMQFAVAKNSLVCGPILFVGPVNVNGDDTSLTKELWNKLVQSTGCSVNGHWS